MPCDTSQTYYITFKPEYIEYILLYMLFGDDTKSLFEYMRVKLKLSYIQIEI